MAITRVHHKRFRSHRCDLSARSPESDFLWQRLNSSSQWVDVKVGIDNSYLSLLLNPHTSGSVANAAAKVETLIADLTDRNATVIVPAPVLTECLVKHGTAI